jgi:transcriptional regulator with XRE-family HTH domain
MVIDSKLAKKIRKIFGLNQLGMANRLGCSEASVSHWESGSNRKKIPEYIQILYRLHFLALTELTQLPFLKNKKSHPHCNVLGLRKSNIDKIKKDKIHELVFEIFSSGKINSIYK